MNEKIASGNVIVKDIDVNGTESLKELLKNDVKVVSIFLRVPKKELKRRLEEREDKLPPDEILSLIHILVIWNFIVLYIEKYLFLIYTGVEKEKLWRRIKNLF